MKPFTIVVALVQTWLMYLTFKATIPATAASAGTDAAPSLLRMLTNRWPLLLMGLLAIVAWLPEIRRIRRSRRLTVRGPVISGQFVDPEVFRATIQGMSLRDFRKGYRVALVVGLSDPTVNKEDDTRISISDVFTITQAPFDIQVNYGPGIIGFVQAQRDAGRAAARADGVAPGTPIAIQMHLPLWADVVLLPNGVLPDQIRRLSDVPRCNGILLNNSILDGSVGMEIVN